MALYLEALNRQFGAPCEGGVYYIRESELVVFAGTELAVTLVGEAIALCKAGAH